MKVSQTNVSYVNYNRRAHVNHGKIGKKDQVNGYNESGSFENETNKINQNSNNLNELDFSKSLASHLSSAEKGMIKTLFSKNKASFGVNAYQKISDDTPETDLRGNSVDLTL